MILSGKRKSHGQIRRILGKLENNQIELIGEYTRIKDRHNFKCICCNHEWTTSLNQILNNNTGCPACAGLVKLTNKIVDVRLLERDDEIYRIDDIINARTKCTWKCSHGHTWDAIPDSVLNNGTGCPICNKTGFYNENYVQLNPDDMTTLATIYFVKFINKISNKSFVKIGITKNTVVKRFSSYKNKYSIQELYTKKLQLIDCINLERDIIYEMREYQYIPDGKFGGKSECFDDIPEVEDKIYQLLE